MVWRVFGTRADDAADGGKEAHVEHAIDFVEDEHFDGVDVDLAAAEEVFETAGRGDDEAWAAVELIELVVLGEAAADEHGIALRAGNELPVGLEDLHGELARGQQDERADGAAFALGAGHRGRVHALDHRDEEAEGLAGAGGGGGENVVAFERGRDGLGLNRASAVVKPALVRRFFSESEMLKSVKRTSLTRERPAWLERPGLVLGRLGWLLSVGGSGFAVRSVPKLQSSKFFLSECPVFGAVIERHRNAGVPQAPWISISQHCLSFIEALLLHGETRPLTCLPARATSAASKSWGKVCGGERRIAVSGQTLNSMKSLCLRCPYSFLSRVQNNHSTAGVRYATNA